MICWFGRGGRVREHGLVERLLVPVKVFIAHEDHRTLA